MMLSGYILKKLLTGIVMPPTGLALVILAGLALHRRFPRTGHALAGCGALALLALSLLPVSEALVRFIAVPSAALDPSIPAPQAIVILSGDMRRLTREYGDTVGPRTLERLRYGASLARAHAVPVLVSGGVTSGGTADAILMRDVLQQDFGVAVKWVESTSRDTHENAVNSAAILIPAGIRRVWVVTDDFHMRRAIIECARAGLEPLAAPVSTIDSTRHGLIEWLPSAGALLESREALHEYAGWLALSILR
jgi:uncharacterized SAM-binding protein YcdF (DUF218 family)